MDVKKQEFPYTSDCGIKYQIMVGGPEGRGYILYEDGSTGTTGQGYTKGPMSMRNNETNTQSVSGPKGVETSKCSIN